jgi:hypothetical protein
MTEKEAYNAWINIANEQQWNLQSQIVLLEGFIRSNGMLPEFAAFVQNAAEYFNDSTRH